MGRLLASHGPVSVYFGGVHINVDNGEILVVPRQIGLLDCLDNCMAFRRVTVEILNQIILEK